MQYLLPFLTTTPLISTTPAFPDTLALLLELLTFWRRRRFAIFEGPEDGARNGANVLLEEPRCGDVHGNDGSIAGALSLERMKSSEHLLTGLEGLIPSS